MSTVGVIFFSAEFRSVLFRSEFGIGSSAELGMPRNEHFRGMKETVPSLFRGIFSERNFVPNPSGGSSRGEREPEWGELLPSPFTRKWSKFFELLNLLTDCLFDPETTSFVSFPFAWQEIR